MGWFERAKAFVAHTTAKAADVEAEFDNIELALNSMLQMGEEVASGKTAFGNNFADIAGTERTIVVDRPSLLLVDVVLDLDLEAGDFFEGVLVVDGVLQTKRITHSAQTGGGHARGTFAAQTYYVELEPGSYDLKLQGKRNGTDVSIFNAANSGYTFLVVPNPEP